MPKKKPLSGYPKEYFTIIRHFMEGREDIRIPMTGREANMQRRNLYRFRDRLEYETRENKSLDKYLKIANDLHFSIHPALARGDEPAVLTISYDRVKAKFEGILSEG